MRNKPHFFLITQVFYPDEVSTANLFTNLCSELAKDKEVKVKVWSAHPSYSSTERQSKRLLYKNIAINYLPSTNFKKDFLVGRLLNYLTFSLSIFFKLLLSKEKFPVFTHTTPPSLGIMIALICKLKKRPFNYILLDIFPDGLVRLNKLSINNVLIQFWRKIHKIALNQCYQIIVIGRDMEKWVKQFTPEVSEKIKYIPIWQDVNLIKPIEYQLNNFVIKNKLENKFVVQYSGNMGLWNDMESLAKMINVNKEDIHFMFIGGGMRKNELIETLNNPNADNISFLPFLSNAIYSESVSACHIAIVSLRKGLEGMAVPSKIIGIMAAGIPVIAMVPKESEISYIVEEEACGIVVEPGNINDLLNAILKLKNDFKLRLLMGNNGRMAFEKKYTTAVVCKIYKSLL